MATLQEISELLQQGRAPKVTKAVQAAIDEGISPKDILEKGLLEGMSIIGEKFKNNEVFVPEVLVAARAMNKGIDVLKPHLIDEDIEKKGTVIIGTVKGDLHDIGKNLVRMMMEGKGLEVIDLGTDVAPQKFIDVAKEKNAQIIACSALLTTTMNEMKTVVELVKNEGLNDKVKVMVGGAPITQSFSDSIGADKFTTDAATAASAALELCTS
ncbi:MAG TPA: cobalamin-binding protein [Clostridiaceae bacterium]|nr:cobalamin-binding protein [Clostridiaceae bacterium]